MAQPKLELGLTLPRPNPDIVRSAETPIPSLRILFNGQEKGAAKLLTKLIDDNHEIVGVVAPKPKKVGDTIKIDPLRQTVLDINAKRQAEGLQPIPIIDLGTVNDAEVQKQMEEMKPDLGVSMYLQKKLDPETFSIPTFGTLNIHYSLLPDERGRNAMERNIMNGYKILGMTAFLTSRAMDAGPVAGYFAYKNNGKSQGSQYYEHEDDSLDLMQGAVTNLAFAIHERKNNRKQKLPLIPQDPSKATNNGLLTKEELFVDFTKMDAVTASNRMNAGGPGATAIIEGKRYKIGKPSIVDSEAQGRVSDSATDSMRVKAADGRILAIGKAEEIA